MTASLRAACCLMLFLSAGAAHAETVSGDLKIFVLNIGQGDAILIVCPHGTHRMLIDTGARGYPGSQDAFMKQMQALVPGAHPTLDVVVSTHPHDDHVGGLTFILTNYRVNTFIDSGRPYTSSFANVPTLVKQQADAGTLKHFQGIDFPPALVADFCPATNLTAELLVPVGYGTSSNPNNNSVVVLITYGTQKFIFTGDAEKSEEGLLLNDPKTASRLSNISFYKVGHHGAETSSTPGLLSAMTPQSAGLSAGCKDVSRNKGYRHPRALTLDALDAIVPGNGTDERTLDSGKTEKDTWTRTTIHKGVYATPVDDTFVIVADGTTIKEQKQQVTGAMGVCPGNQ